MNKKILAIIFGGRSVEHEISIISARSIINNVNRDLFRLLIIYIQKNGIWKIVDTDALNSARETIKTSDSLIIPSFDPNNPGFIEISENRIINSYEVDVIFPILHGTYGEDGTIQGLFEFMNIPFVGASVLGSSIGMDKIVTKFILRQANIPVTDYIAFNRFYWRKNSAVLLEKISNSINFSCFIKSADLGSSVGITKVNSKDKVEDAVELALKYSHRIIVEKAVLNPREIEVSVLGNEEPIASLPGEVIPKREFYDYEAKYIEDSTDLVIPAKLEDELTEKLQIYAIETFKALDCSGMGRVDFLINGETNEIFVSELNTIPGFTQISMYPKLWEVSGITYPDLITKLVELAFEKFKSKSKLNRDLKI